MAVDSQQRVSDQEHNLDGVGIQNVNLVVIGRYPYLFSITTHQDECDFLITLHDINSNIKKGKPGGDVCHMSHVKFICVSRVAFCATVRPL